jgi:hypothetical protein
MRTGNAAVAWAKAQKSWATGMCQQYVRSCFDLGGYYASAADAWRGAKKKHTLSGDGSSAPRGVPIFWLGGSKGYGHIAMGLGNGMCRSTDWPSRGKVGDVKIDTITRTWHQDLVGWSEDLNNVTIWTKPDDAKTQPTVDLSDVINATKKDTKVKYGAFLKKALGKEVGKGSMNYGNTILGKGWQDQYVKLQKKYLKSINVKPTAKNADGIPGKASLTWLGKRQGFKVKD